MSRPAIVAVCAVVLVAGFVAGRASRSGSGGATTLRETVEHTVVVSAAHLGAAADGVDAGPIDVAHVTAVRQGGNLVTTITARKGWASSLLRRGGPVRLSVLYDTNADGKPDYRDVVFQLQGQLTSWISSFGQGVAVAHVTRPSDRTITIARDASVFFSASGQAPLLWTMPIGIAVVAGRDRAPNRGWVTVPVPAPSTAPTVSTPALHDAAPPAATTTSTSTTCADPQVALARIDRDLAALRRAARLPTASKLDGNQAINVATDAFLRDVALAPITNVRRNRLLDRAAAAVSAVCQQCFQAFEAARPIPGIRAGDNHCGSS